MKRCPRCDRTYTDDSLLFCLEDGAHLGKPYDPEATQITPFPPVTSPVVKPPPTVAYTPPAAPAPFVSGPYEDSSRPARKRSPLMVVGLVVGALIIGLVVGAIVIRGLISGRSTSDGEDPRPTPSVRTTPAATPSPSPSSSTTNPTPTPTATPTPTPRAGGQDDPNAPRCVLYNDKSDKGVVNTRLNCDTRNCDTDASTIAGEYPNDTPVNVYEGSSVRGSKFTWVKVKIKGSGPGPGTTVWVASTKIKCN